MNEQINIFLKVLQFGVESNGKTISFNEVVLLLKNDFIILEEMKPIVRRWFYDYYFIHETYRKKRGLSNNSLNDSELIKYDNDKAYFTGDGYFKYYKYLEVKEAYHIANIAVGNSEKASREAKSSLNMVKIALVISSVIGLTQIFLMILYR